MLSYQVTGLDQVDDTTAAEGQSYSREHPSGPGHHALYRDRIALRPLLTAHLPLSTRVAPRCSGRRALRDVAVLARTTGLAIPPPRERLDGRARGAWLCPRR